MAGAASLIRQTFSGSDVMIGRTSLLKATALALPFSLAAAAAHAASIAETVQQQAELSTFAQAMEAAKFAAELSGQGPYTVFAPTDQAFEQLPAGALDELMKQENRAQLTRLLEHHVVEGQAIAAKDALGQQSQIDTMSGDTLTVDGSTQVVLLVPRAGAGQQQGQQAQGQMQGQQAAGAQTTTAEGSDMPMSPHQQQALESQPAPDQQQTAATGTADMPATEHQQQVIQDQAGQGQGQAHGQGQQQSYEDAAMTGMPDLLRAASVVGADIQADNGVIHVIDAVLLPQDVLKMLEERAKEGQG
jgi:uncharacterized surface protein with fasciclin (FAS1) repeats